MQTIDRPTASRTEPAATPRKGTLLLVEDDTTLSDLLARMLRAEAYRVDVIAHADLAAAPLRPDAYDAVLSDIHLERGTGYDVLRAVHEASPATPVILMTAFAEIEGAMKSVAEGAYDYLPKPIDPIALKRMVSEAVARRKLASTATKIDPTPSKRRIVGTSAAMIEVYKTVAQVAPTTATVLVVGESGTGKELVAREIHAHSRRADKPFVAVNCAALPESILESELFGHEKGAFTGATTQKRGLFEEASGGTLFLDEIGEISPKMQVQLLRVLQEGEIRRVGGSKPIKVDVRVIAATNRELKGEVAEGRFREDLLFRLQVVTIFVPPLRDRKQDIAPLVDHFLAMHGQRLERPPVRLGPAVIQKLEAYDYPGNVRELSHIVERAMLMAREGVVTVHDLPIEVGDKKGAGTPASLAEDWPTLAVLGRRYIDRVLVYTGNNKTRAAEVLGIDRRTLNRMFAREAAAMKAMGVDNAPVTSSGSVAKPLGIPR